MRTILHVAAVLAALFGSLTTLAAQDSAVQRLAAAKLHDSRGELALAEQDLRTALSLATPGERDQVVKELAALLVRQGRSDEAAALTRAEPQQPATGQDPIQRLIGLMDSSAGTSEPAKDAIAQLGTLGSLAVPPLLAALPKLGPFGQRNALELLQPHDDARVAAALAQLVDTADPTFVATLAGRLRQFQRGVALPLAHKLAEPRFPVAVRCWVLAALVAQGAPDADVRALALQLAADPSEDTSRRLSETLRKTNEPWAVDVFAVLKDRGSPEDRATALVEWLRRQKGATEELALAELKKLASEQVPGCAITLAEKNPSWVHVAMLALQAGPPSSTEIVCLGKIEWWRLPDESAPLLLRLVREGRGTPRRNNPQGPQGRNDIGHITHAIREMTARGWKVPLGLDSALVELAVAGGNWDPFVAALPVDAEDRALAVWSGLPPGTGWLLAHSAVGAERPWHRLVAKQLAAATRADEVRAELLQRDWRGAPPEAAELLAELAKRWPEGSTGGELQWHGSFVNAYERCPNLPVAGLMPLLGKATNASVSAWSIVVTRDPAAALAYARGADRVVQARSVLELIPEHGDANDIPLALRTLETLRNSGLPDLSRLIQFLAKHGAGNLDVLALARLPMPPNSREVWLRIARDAARGARVQDLAAILELLPGLQQACAGDLMRAIEPQLTAEHAGLLVRAIEARLAEPLRPDNDPWQNPIPGVRVLEWLVQSLGRVGDASAAPVLQRVIAHPDLNATLVTGAARAMLRIAGSGRRALLLEMLQSPKVPVACAALDVPELLTDADVRAAARAAVLRLGEQQLMDKVDPFGALDEAERLALAKAILESERFPRLDDDLCRYALELLGARKDPSLVPTLLRGAAHPDASVRMCVAQQLGMTFAREAAGPLIEMLKDDSDDVRKEAQKALDQIANYLDARAKWEARLK